MDWEEHGFCLAFNFFAILLFTRDLGLTLAVVGGIYLLWAAVVGIIWLVARLGSSPAAALGRQGR